MIIWLASYPRSGNTLCRQFINSVFLEKTYSKYSEAKNLAKNDEISNKIGHLKINETWEEFYKKALAAAELFFIKTHEPPQDNSQAIYILRDGRSSIISYFHFLHFHSSMSDVTSSKVIKGDVPFGSWSGHISEWLTKHERNILLLRYEDFLRQPQIISEKIATFTGLVPKKGFQNNFKELNFLFPSFFRSGSDHINLKEFAKLKEEDQETFWFLHGEAMKKYKYI